jgi:glycosyltransferase involved in cell wall biosynthesis
MEATSVTGPAKNLLGYCRWLQSPEGLRTSLHLTVATFERGSSTGKANSFVDAARSAGVDTYVIRERFRYDPAVVPQLRGILAQVKPAIIQTHNNKSHLLVRSLSAAHENRVWFAFHHGDTHTNLKQRAYNQLDRLTLRSAARVITVCQAFVPQLVSRGVKPDRIRVLHNPSVPARIIAAADRRKLREELAIGADEAVILAVGRLSREKGQEHLIRALAQLPPAASTCRLVLLGSGPDLQRLETLAAALGVSRRILFVGFRADVASFYAIAKLFALPSLTEGSSNVLLEAMAAGVPIVATRVGGNPEIALHEQTALLVPPADPTALADALLRLLTDRDLASRLTAAAQTRATVEFSEQRYRQRLSSVYADAIGAGA